MANRKIMDSIKKLWATFSEAVRDKRHGLDFVYTIVVLGLHWIASEFPGYPLSQTPIWFVVAFVFLCLISWWVLSYATHLREKLVSKIRITRNDTTYTTLSSPIVFSNSTGPDLTFVQKALFIQLVVESVGSHATNCIGYLRNVRKNNEKTNYEQSMKLEWGFRRHDPIEVRLGTEQRLNIAYIDQTSKKLIPSVEFIPNNCKDVFDDLDAEYRFDIIVTSENGDGVSKLVYIKQNPEQWESPTIRMVDAQ